MRGVWAWGRQRDELGARPRPGSPHLSPSVLASALIFTADLCTNLRHVHGHGRARRHLVPILPVWFHSCTNPQAFMILIFLATLQGGTSGKKQNKTKPTCPCRRRKRRRFDPWVGKIPWRRAQQPTPVFLPGESHGQRATVHGVAESDTTEAT